MSKIEPVSVSELMKLKLENLSGPQKLRMAELNNVFEYQSLDS